MHCELQIRCRPRWWVMPYLNTLIFLCTTFGVGPSWERFNYWVSRGIVIEAWIGGRWRQIS